MPIVPFLGDAYDRSSKAISSQSTTNLYPEIIVNENDKAKSAYILKSTPGTDLYLDLTAYGEAGICRGIYTASNNRVFAVYGARLYEINNSMAPTATLRGTISLTASGSVSFADNGYYLVFCDGVNLYRLQFSTDVLAEIVLPVASVFIPTKVVYFAERFAICGRGINNPAESNKVYFSDSGPNGPLTWDALYFYTKKNSADPIVGIAAVQEELWVFGSRSYQVFTRTGIFDDPFTIAGGSYSDVGASSADSIYVFNGIVYWLGSSTVGTYTLFQSNGYQAVRISETFIEERLSAASLKPGVSPSDCKVWGYYEDGHSFISFHFISADFTIVYDPDIREWHYRLSRDPLLNILHRWAAIYGTKVGDKILVGYSDGPQKLTLDSRTHTEWNKDYYPNEEARYRVPIMRERVSPVYWENLQTIIIDEFRVDLDAGVGVVTPGRGFDPKVQFGVSRDGGRNFVFRDDVPMGRVGAYTTSVAIRDLGSARNMVIKLRITDPVRVTLLAARMITRMTGRR